MSYPAISLFLTAAVFVCAAPGPSTLLVLAHSASRDVRRPVMLILGAVAANSAMIAVVAIGFGQILNLTQNGLFWFKIIGGSYLVWLGASYVFSRNSNEIHIDTHRFPHSKLMAQAFLTSMTNPKALLFYTAFLPGFVVPGEPYSKQIAAFGALYLAIFAISLLAYAVAGYLLGVVAPSAAIIRLRDRVLGCFLIASGVALFRWAYAK
ncbi:MAG: LysE family translocator [Pseudomonadota bacterium]